MSLTDHSPSTNAAADDLRRLCGGAVHLPGDRGYDDSRTPWNLAVEQRPAAVVYPASAEEVAEVVRTAAAHGLRVAPQATGHNAGPLPSLVDTVLLRTSAMQGVDVDPARGRVTVGAGTLWVDVVEAVAQHGLAVLHGSSPDVGVVGYSLGGGIGWYARACGLQANAVTAAEVVTADGHIVRSDACNHSELFWALRGGGANVGIVTELEFRTFPFATAYAGMLAWDLSRAGTVLSRWVGWAASAPDEVTTSLRFFRFPDVPGVPSPFRGRAIVIIDGAVLADDQAAERILAPLRELTPELDTFDRVDTASLVRLHMDPETPTPGASADALLGGLPSSAIERLLAVAGPDAVGAPPMVELRQLGGALGRPAPDAGALPLIDGRFLLFAGGLALTAEMQRDSETRVADVIAAMSPWTTGRRYLNFTESSIDPRHGYRAEDWDRLRRIRAEVDPAGVLVANHAIRSTDTPTVQP